MIKRKGQRGRIKNINHGHNSVILHTFNSIKKIEQNHQKKVNKSAYKMSTKKRKKAKLLFEIEKKTHTEKWH